MAYLIYTLQMSLFVMRLQSVSEKYPLYLESEVMTKKKTPSLCKR